MDRAVLTVLLAKPFILLLCIASTGVAQTQASVLITALSRRQFAE